MQRSNNTNEEIFHDLLQHINNDNIDGVMNIIDHHPEVLQPHSALYFVCRITDDKKRKIGLDKLSENFDTYAKINSGFSAIDLQAASGRLTLKDVAELEQQSIVHTDGKLTWLEYYLISDKRYHNADALDADIRNYFKAKFKRKILNNGYSNHEFFDFVCRFKRMDEFLDYIKIKANVFKEKRKNSNDMAIQKFDLHT